MIEPPAAHSPRRALRLAERWIMGRARQFWPDGMPMWSYAEIARNIGRSKRFAPRLRMSKYAVRRVVVRHDPELAKRRGDAYEFAVRARRAVDLSQESPDLPALR